MKLFLCFNLLSAFAFSNVYGSQCESLFTQWGAYPDVRTGQMKFSVPENTVKWRVDIVFDKAVNSIEAWEGTKEKCIPSKNKCFFENEHWNKHNNQGSDLHLGFKTVYASTDTPPKLKKVIFKYCTSEPCQGWQKFTVECDGDDSGVGEPEPTNPPATDGPTNPPATDGPTNPPATNGPTEPPVTTNAPVTSATEEPVENGQCSTELTNYKDVLHKSLLFYEAQRSGKLPADNRIPWRRDSALNDGSDVGVDLTGGYYDAGDFVKFNFPQAQALTTLAWGGITWQNGYKCAGEWDNLLDAIKWGTDFFLKCHVSDNVFYGQVGNGDIDHATWSRPEDMGNMQRPSYKIDCQKPGTDLAAETAASFASAAILFKGEDDDYSTELLDHAKTLYKFADECRGKYSDSIWDANTYYKSWSGYNDELVWGAAWLHKATGDPAYLAKAKQYYNDFSLEGKIGIFSWDDKTVGVHALMAEMTGEAKYKDSLKKFCDHAVSGQQKSPGGMLYYMEWGSLRYAANAAFICLQAADIVDGKDNDYTDLAQGQMDYILGGNPKGQSFVIGVGSKYPQNPHHSASSCPNPPSPCGWNEYNSSPTTNELIGALVGGCRYPDDNYNDERSDYFSNEVTLDYNAGFQGAIAGLQLKKCCAA